jgi:mono/diheme cytochrome c family protein
MKIRLLILSLFFISAVKAAPPVEEGKTIFAASCAACHNINKILTGPALAGVHERRSIDWIVNFVHSSQTVIKKGDPYAVALFNKFNKIQMPDHPDLTPENIKNVVEYIKTESKTGAEQAPFSKPAKLHPAYMPLSIANSGFFFAGYLALVALLIFALLIAVRTKEYERNINEGK